jgi:Leucine-rich repeat (LRR) protein
MAFADSPNHVNVTSPRLQQRYALLVLYFSNGGEKWRINPEAHECDWKFCVCKNSSVITKLFMGSQLGMTGLLPGEIGLLTDLKHLDLQQNRLEGKLPESLFNLSKLGTFLLGSRCVSRMFHLSTGAFRCCVSRVAVELQHVCINH